MDDPSHGDNSSRAQTSAPDDATIGLLTAAHMLGISQADAADLAKRDEFPCVVIRTHDGHRVPFAAFLQVLRSSQDRGRSADWSGPRTEKSRKGEGS
jgi:hypothetical protein